MSGNPEFLKTPRIGGAISTTADASRTAPTNAASIITGAAGGTKIERVVFQGVDTTQRGIAALFVYDGSTYRCIDEIPIIAVTKATPMLTSLFRCEIAYYDLILPSASWSLRFTVAPTTSSTNAGMVMATAFGGDLV